MSVRRQRYFIQPPSACPTGILLPSGQPPSEIELDIADVARCALGEVFQTAPHSASAFAFLEDLLAPGGQLVWREGGLGRGTEMRRSFSALFGRFFARSYLQVHHGYIWFSAIDGNPFRLSENWRVAKRNNSKTEMPDWVCARAGELAIAEAKGSHQTGNPTGPGYPGPIKTASGQIQGVLVQRRVGSGRSAWVNKQVKGWAVMSRWGVMSPPRDPFLFALDPNTEGEPMLSPDTEELIALVARGHVEQLATGLGLLEPSKGELSPKSHLSIRLGHDDPKGVYAGVFIGPLGVLNTSLEGAREIAALLPNPDSVKFLGLDERVLDDYVSGRPISPTERRHLGDQATIGDDGLVLAPIRQVLEAKA